jgi:hypothetical protein
LVTALVARAKIEVIDPDLRFAIARADSLRAVHDEADRAARGFSKALPEPDEGRPRAASAPRDTAAASAPTETETQSNQPQSNAEADSSGE